MIIIFCEMRCKGDGIRYKAMNCREFSICLFSGFTVLLLEFQVLFVESVDAIDHALHQFDFRVA